MSAFYTGTMIQDLYCLVSKHSGDGTGGDKQQGPKPEGNGNEADQRYQESVISHGTNVPLPSGVCQALKEWNTRQPAHKPVKTFGQLTEAERAEVLG